MIEELIRDIAEALQARFPDALVRVGTLPSQGIPTDQIAIGLSVERFSNARSREPLGDSPLAPGEYEIAIRYEAAAMAETLPQSYAKIEEIYGWAQSQERRHTALFHYSLPTALQFAVNGDIIYGWWQVLYRIRQPRG